MNPASGRQSMSAQLSSCLYCQQPFELRPSYPNKQFCSKPCGARYTTRTRKRKLSDEEEACLCGLPRMSGERLCRLCQLEGLKANVDYPSLRQQRISAGPGNEGHVELVAIWFGSTYAPRGGNGQSTWLTCLLDEIAPLERGEEEVAGC